jgi:hypothetical protein
MHAFSTTTPDSHNVLLLYFFLPYSSGFASLYFVSRCRVTVVTVTVTSSTAASAPTLAYQYIRAALPSFSLCDSLGWAKPSPQVEVTQRVALRKSAVIIFVVSFASVSVVHRLVLVPTPTVALVISTPSRSLSIGLVARAFAICSRRPLLGLLTRHHTTPSPLNHPSGLCWRMTAHLELRMPCDLDAPRFPDPCPYSLLPPLLPFLDLVFSTFFILPRPSGIPCHRTQPHLRAAQHIQYSSPVSRAITI